MAGSFSSGGRSRLSARLVALGVAVAAVAAVPAGSAGSAGLAAVAGRLSVPWSKAGPGWSVVQFSAAKVVNNRVTSGASTLYLVSPSGQRFAVRTWTRGPFPNLVDWSGDRTRALMVTQVTPTGRAVVEQVSLATGKVSGRFTLPSLTFLVGYTKPDGLNLLAIHYLDYDGTRIQLIRYNLAGVRQRVLATISNGFVRALYAPDGTYLVATARDGLQQISNSGGVTRRFRPATTQVSCTPVRWWNPATVLAICFRTRQDSVGRLWLFHLRTGRSSPLTAVTGYDQNNAWYLADGQFLQQSLICSFLDQVYRNGSVHETPVPGNSTVQIVGAVGGRLLLAGQRQCQGPSTSLLWFDPKRHRVSYLIRPGRNVIGVVAVAPFGGALVEG